MKPDMLTDDKAWALGLRAKACKGWRWMPGMLIGRVLTGGRPYPAWARLGQPRPDFKGYAPGGSEWPDLRDPATVGCLIALVREAWGDQGMNTVMVSVGGTPAWSCAGQVLSANEAESLVSALEGAP